MSQGGRIGQFFQPVEVLGYLHRPVRQKSRTSFCALGRLHWVTRVGFGDGPPGHCPGDAADVPARGGSPYLRREKMPQPRRHSRWLASRSPRPSRRSSSPPSHRCTSALSVPSTPIPWLPGTGSRTGPRGRAMRPAGPDQFAALLPVRERGPGVRAPRYPGQTHQPRPVDQWIKVTALPPQEVPSGGHQVRGPSVASHERQVVGTDSERLHRRPAVFVFHIDPGMRNLVLVEELTNGRQFAVAERSKHTHANESGTLENRPPRQKGFEQLVAQVGNLLDHPAAARCWECNKPGSLPGHRRR